MKYRKICTANNGQTPAIFLVNHLETLKHSSR